MESTEHQLLNNIKMLHEQNAKLQQEVDILKSYNDQLTTINLKVSQERDDLTVVNYELSRKLKSIQALFL
jgi:FtsZ-binding cell division protein ZapB